MSDDPIPQTSPEKGIERFEYLERIGVLQQAPDGDWVRYSDHRSLVEGLVEVAGDVIEFEARIERSGDAGSMEDYEGAINDLRAALTKAQASLKGDTQMSHRGQAGVWALRDNEATR